MEIIVPALLATSPFTGGMQGIGVHWPGQTHRTIGAGQTALPESPHRRQTDRLDRLKNHPFAIDPEHDSAMGERRVRGRADGIIRLTRISLKYDISLRKIVEAIPKPLS